jgi:2'-5' RNA ligase
VKKASLSTATYHLWFKPPGAAYDILARTIRELAPQLNSPIFEPHVSLIGNLGGSESEIAERIEKLGQRLHPFGIALTEPSYRDDHFRCLFMLVEQNPFIMNANAVARDLFHQKSNQAFFPHLSLAYGSCSEAHKKLIIGNVAPDVRTTFEVETLYLIRADSLEPKDWHEIVLFPMDRSVQSSELS